MKKDGCITNKHDCIVYIESVVATKYNTYEVYLDFRLERDLKIFIEAFGLNSKNKWHEKDLREHIDDATLIRIINLKSSKRLRHGCYYKLNISILKDYQINYVENSFVIGYFFNLNEMKIPSNEAMEILQGHDKLDSNELRIFSENRIESLCNYINRYEDFDTVLVKNVGQANWNELWSRSHKIDVLFDAGAALNASKNEVNNIFMTRKCCLYCSKPTLILSHWDIDHIHCLKYLSEQDIKMCFRKLICVANIKTLTSKRIYEKFIKVLGSNNVFALNPLLNHSTFSMINVFRTGNISIYQGRYCSNVNYCGLIMFVKGKKASTIFTGDARLSQANEVYCQEMSSGVKTSQHILIAPHHGGYFKPVHTVYSHPCQCVLISVGNNGYGHPNSTMLTYYNSFGEVKRTDINGDIIKHI